MKRIHPLPIIAFLIISFGMFTLFPVNTYSQSKTQDQTLAVFPDSMAVIFKQSCVGCHFDQSESKAKEFMNLSEWDRLNSKKQAKTARQINKQVAKGHMPPPESVEKFPEEALSAEQKQTIRTWSKAIRKNKKN